MSTATLTEPLSEAHVYRPYGGAVELMGCQAGEILLDGPAGTGKTRAVIQKTHYLAAHFPGLRVLWMRRTRSSMTQSVLVTFERDVLPRDSYLLTPRRERQLRQTYHYPNGAEIVLGGLDNKQKFGDIMSTEYDLICIFEATEITLNDWESLTSRLRNGVLPYQQAIADCNPSYPAHWLKRRADAGMMTRILSRHQDNPKVTPEYLDRLSRLSGHRRARLYVGQWVAAEGIIYDRWDDAVHVQPRKALWKRVVVGIDEGYSNPCSMGVWGVDGDGRMHRIEEWYETRKLEKFVVERAGYYSTKYDVEAFVVDPSAAALMAALMAAGLPVVAGDNDVFDGIQAVQQRLEVQADGMPRLTVAPECRSFVDEVQSYQWRENRDGSLRDEPLKANDHAMDDTKYVVRYVDATSGSMEVFAI